METNEDLKNVNEQVAGMDATQKIVIVDELIKDTENSKIENSVDCSTEKIEEQPVLPENPLKNEEAEENILSDKRLQNTIRLDCLNEIKNINFVDENNNSQDNEEHQEVLTNNEPIEENIQQNENNEVAEKTEVIEQVENVEETSEEKEKRHSQDKKDYRLERMLFEKTNAMQGKIKESLELIRKFERINAKEENLPNIVTTLRDKLTQEVIKQCRTVGIEFNMNSYLVQAIVSDLLNKLDEGLSEFKNCSKNLDFVKEVQDDFESRVELVPTSKVKNLIARLRGLFKPEKKQEHLEQLERERQERKLEEANIHLIKYKFKNSELEKYTIKNNIVSSLTREMLFGTSAGLNLTVEEFINKKIKDEMCKLGLQNLLPALEENLFNEYKVNYMYAEKDSFMNMQIGEVKRNMKATRVGYIRTKVNTISHNEDFEEMAI